jgi:phospholipid/cholesterol/gamma-HCH transport system ATP-binding protein
MISIKNITKQFGNSVVLDNVSFEVSNELVVVLGPTGTGKTVLLKIIIGLTEPDSGKVIINEGETIGFVFQHSALFDSLNVRENIALPLKEHLSISEKEIRARVESVAKILGLSIDFLKRNVTALSGGERKIVAIARAIINNPNYILYDEPTTGLDPITHDRICEIIKNLSKPGILVTHSRETIKRIGAKNIFLLKSGKLNKLSSVDSQELTKEHYE